MRTITGLAELKAAEGQDLGRAHLRRALLARLLEQDRHVLRRALEHVAVAGEDHGVAARSRLGGGVAAHQVVGLQVRAGLHAPAQRLVQARGE